MTKFCMLAYIQDLINHVAYATFGDDRLRGLGVARGRTSRFPIDLRRRLVILTTLSHYGTVRVCDFRWSEDAIYSIYFLRLSISNGISSAVLY